MKSKIFKYIYAMLCLLPAIAVGVTCLYVGNNENAYRSYSGADSVNVTIDNVEDDTILEVNKLYTLALTRDTSFTTSSAVVYSVNVVSFSTTDSSLNTFFTDKEVITIRTSTNANYIMFTAEDSSIGYFYFTSTSAINVDFTLNVEGNSINLGKFLSVRSVNNYYYIDNVFYYSLDKVENSSVFSWVKSNFLYSGVNQFVGIFGGTNSNISFYLTWVLTISLCYLGFEVLMLFINMARNLIHSFTDKERW